MTNVDRDVLDNGGHCDCCSGVTLFVQVGTACWDDKEDFADSLSLSGNVNPAVLAEIALSKS